MKKKIISIMLIMFMVFGLAGCTSAADRASENLSKDADQFKIQRRIVFFNGITDTYLLTIEGRCSIEVDTEDGQLEVTCKIGEDAYKKHFLGLSDNVTYFVEQAEAANVSEYNYKVIFRPETIIPDIDLDVSGS
jgi:hypothetical protein